MSIISQKIKRFKSGTYNVDPDESIPQDAASDSLGWNTVFGAIYLMAGRQTIGGAGAAGKNYGEHIGYKADGTRVRFRKVQDKIQVLVGNTWTNVITGLTIAADYTFANYSSLAGTFTYIFGVDGIYKICTANPTSYAALYNSAKNFKGFGLIDKGRTLLWGRKEDPTGLYGSYIDAQNSTVYTTVSSESVASLSGTLAFKAGGATRTCFGVSIVVGSETFTDNFNGVLTGSLGGTGTINYMTGAYTVSTAGSGSASYQWEDSNAKGVTDFTKSSTRLAGEGFILRQDVGGDAIMSVLPLAGSYFSLKRHSSYQLTLDATDLAPNNIIFRTDIGIASLRSAVSTSRGIIFMNTGNATTPILQQLKQNTLGDNFDVKPLLPQFAFENYTYDDALVDSWDRFVIIGCKQSSDENNRLILGNLDDKTVDVAPYGVRTTCKLDGVLYGGDPLSQTTYELFTGNDDLGTPIMNNWDSKGETFGSDVLKKVKRRRVRGGIGASQVVEIYESYDDSDFTLIGTILGSGSYVDYSTTYALGTSGIGAANVGGGQTPAIFPFYMPLKVRGQKFRKRKVRFVATGIGPVAIDQYEDEDIWTYQDKIPSRYRTKQNVALAGEPVDMDDPDY